MKISEQQNVAYFDRRVPFSRFEYVDVTFPSTANLDMDIPHSLTPADPETVRWMVVNMSTSSAPGVPPVVYKNTSAARTPWQTTHIYLRCTEASIVVRLLLFLE